jgi:hypothetical protein
MSRATAMFIGTFKLCGFIFCCLAQGSFQQNFTKDLLHHFHAASFLLPVDIRQYQTWMQAYFPIPGADKRVPEKTSK